MFLRNIKTEQQMHYTEADLEKKFGLLLLLSQYFKVYHKQQ